MKRMTLLLAMMTAMTVGAYAEETEQQAANGEIATPHSDQRSEKATIEVPA